MKILLAALLIFSALPFANAQTLVAFGDSVTATRGTIPVYASILSRELLFQGKAIKAHNAGVGGNTTAMALKRFETDVLAKKPDVVILMFGINDSAVDVWKNPPATVPRVPLDDYRANLIKLTRALKASGARVVLMTSNPLSWTESSRKLYAKPPYIPEAPDGFNVMLRDYAQAVREIAVEESVGLVDVFAAFQKRPETLTPDGMHPGEEGHRLIADLVIDYLAVADPRFSRRSEPIPKKEP